MTPPTADPEAARLTLPPGFFATVAARGLDGPTQFIPGPGNALWIAQLAGDENAGRGQVLEIDLVTGARRVLLDGLVKPTGIAI